MKKRFLMCEPEKFSVSYVINPWMQSQVGKVDELKARNQWHQLYKQIRSKASISLMDDWSDSLPDLVFTANAAFVYKGVAFLSSFAKNERRSESELYAKALREEGYKIDSYFVDNKIDFEGARDALLSFDKKTLYLGYGHRSAKKCFDYLDQNTDKEIGQIMPLELVNPNFYHLDTCLCPLSKGFVMGYLGAFDKISQNVLLDSLGDKFISVSEKDANSFACNAVEYAPSSVVLNCASPHLVDTLKDNGFDVTQIDLSEFMKSGGSAKCLTLEIEPPRL